MRWGIHPISAVSAAAYGVSAAKEHLWKANQGVFLFSRCGVLLSQGRDSTTVSISSAPFQLQKMHQPKERRRRSGVCLRCLSAAKITNTLCRKRHSTIAETLLISKVFKVLCQWNSYHDSYKKREMSFIKVIICHLLRLLLTKVKERWEVGIIHNVSEGKSMPWRAGAQYQYL